MARGNYISVSEKMFVYHSHLPLVVKFIFIELLKHLPVFSFSLFASEEEC